MSESEKALNVVQEVLRGIVVGLAASSHIDSAKFATSMQTFASHPDIDPMSKVMLLDLAEGLDMLGRMKQAPS